METNQSFYFTYQLASFYKRGTLALYRLKIPFNRPLFTVIAYLLIYLFTFTKFIFFHFISCCNKPNKQ